MSNARSYDGRMLAIERLWPTKESWLIGSPFARRTPSPFSFLKEFPGWESVADKLIECGELEIEMDVLGRELQIFGAWEGAKGLWFEALEAAVTRREMESITGLPVLVGEGD